MKTDNPFLALKLSKNHFEPACISIARWEKILGVVRYCHWQTGVMNVVRLCSRTLWKERYGIYSISCESWWILLTGWNSDSELCLSFTVHVEWGWVNCLALLSWAHVNGRQLGHLGTAVCMRQLHHYLLWCCTQTNKRIDDCHLLWNFPNYWS